MPQNTLFSYFSKSPKVNPKRDVASPTLGETPDKRRKGNSPKEEAKQRRPSNAENEAYQLYDLVWAKLGTFPWWPSIVCNHPTSKNFVKGKGKKLEVHVQFFEDPPSRSWIKATSIYRFNGINDKNSPATEGDVSWEKAVNSADKAITMLQSERQELITCTAPSDDEVESMHEDEIEDLSADEDESPKNKKRKLNKVLSDIDDSEDDYRPGKDASESESDSSGVDESMISDPEVDEPDVSPVKMPKKRKRVEKTPINKTPKTHQSRLSMNGTPQSANKSSLSMLATPSPKAVSSHTKAKLSLFSASPCNDKSQSDNSSESKVWTHLKYDWLKDGIRRDKEKRTQDHPDFNPRTLHIPDSVKKTLTPAMRQWWELKSDHFQTILFFKVGKFYELYNQDAVVGVQELGLLFMRGEYAHSGFPEIAFSRYADMLIEKGYKVARIEQTETPAMMEERCKKMAHVTKYDKVVRREICRVISKGARTCSFIDGNCNNHQSNYLLAVKEKKMDDSVGGKVEIGVAFIDTTIGKFHIGQFHDDRHRSRFRTLISHYSPAQLLIERNNLSKTMSQIVESNLTNVIKDVLSQGSEFWTSKKTLTYLSEGKFFCNDQSCSKICFPSQLSAMMDKDDTLLQTALPQNDLAIQALGACVWYLESCCIDQELLSMKSFELYEPIDASIPSVQSSFNQQNMVLDGITLQNLDVVENSSTGTSEGTLLQRIDNCSTSFGKRLIRQWLCSPLCNPTSIEDRLNAIEDLLQIPDIVSETCDIMKKLPDLERQLSKIHCQGSAIRSKSHPESRAIFFEDAIYSKRKITDFISALQGFKQSCEITQLFNKSSSKFKSHILKQCVKSCDDGGHFPSLKQHLSFFDNAFDHEKAQKDGKIIPSKGVDQEYDDAVEIIKKTEKELDKYINDFRKKYQCKLVYFGTGKNRFQMEIPDQAARHVGDEFELQSQRKGFKRYWTPSIKTWLHDIMAAEEKRDAALKDIMRRIFEQFDSHYKQWLDAVHCLAILDVLISFTQFSQSANMCRPVFQQPTDQGQSFIDITEGFHPCIGSTYSGGEFIPNDVSIAAASAHGQISPSLVIVTGPNMGGKSTLMRQTGLLVILAQLGCYVPASKCLLSPVDRIFTRLGASDRIMAGESTFFVELNETSSILQHATKHSLVLMDELGRGTATYDGTAIACAVVQQLASQIQCRTLFSTHYHSLVEDFANDARVKLGHMACMVENENHDDPSQETITFLYKFIEGACPKSYGFNAATLAGLPDHVIREGHQKAAQFEKTVESIKLFKNVFHSLDPVNFIKESICL